MRMFDSSRLPASSDELLRRLGMIEDRGRFDSALAGLALVATGMVLGAGLSRLLATRAASSSTSTVPAADERGVRPLTEA